MRFEDQERACAPKFRATGIGAGSLLSFLALLIFSRTAAALPDAGTAALMTEAAAAYERGDCPAALQLYEGLVTSPTVPTEVWDEALFRRGYCFYTVGEFERSYRAFHGFVARHPENAEARLKLAQSMFNINLISQAYDESLRVPRGPYDVEARILTGRSLIELRRYPEAVETLRAVPSGGLPHSTALYWIGVAFYQDGKEERAINAFRWSIYKAPAEAWTREAADAWIRRIRSEQRLKLRLGFGFFYDGNVGQSATATPGQSNQAVEVFSANTDYLRDHGYSLDAVVDSALIVNDRFRVNSSFNVAGTFYKDYSSFNYESFGGRLDGIYPVTPFVRTNFSLAYLDTRYNYRYYQDYLIFTPGVSWDAKPNLSLGFSLPVTYYMLTRNYWSYTPTATVNYQFPWFYSWAGVNYTFSAGDGTVIEGSDTSLGVTSGTLFSRYEAAGLFLGVGRTLPGQFDFNFQFSLTHTNYDDPGLPVAADASFSRDARTDTLMAYSFTLSKVLSERKLTANVNFTYTANDSAGFQGLLSSSTSSPNYNYSRRFLSLNFSFSP